MQYIKSGGQIKITRGKNEYKDSVSEGISNTQNKCYIVAEVETPGGKYPLGTLIDCRITQFDPHINPGSNEAEVESESGSRTHRHVVDELVESEPGTLPGCIIIESPDIAGIHKQCAFKDPE